MVDSNTYVTNDSAVAVYWNPVSVGTNQSIDVSTYYGVGYALSEEEVGTSTVVPVNGFSIQITDKDGKPIANAVVKTENEEQQTNEDGIAIFTSIPQGAESGFNIQVTKDGYQDRVVTRSVSKGGLIAATIYADDGETHVISAVASLDSTTFDLVNSYKFLKSNPTKVSGDKDDTHVKMLSVNVEACGKSRITKYQLLQGGEVKVESASSTIEIPVFTGTAEDTDKFGDDWRIDKLDAGKTVYLRVVDENGNASEQKKLGFRISDPVLYGISENTGTLSFSNAFKIKVPDDYPIIGGKEVEFGWEGLPFRIEVSEEGKVKFAINPEIDLLTGEVDWDSSKNDYELNQLKAIQNRLDAKAAFGGELQKFGAGEVEVKANLMGYGEGYRDEYGNIMVDVGLLITISEEAEYTWTYFLGYVPVYIAVGENVKLKGMGQLNITSSNGNIEVTGATGEINPSITLNVDGGVGANGVLNVGASGRATLG